MCNVRWIKFENSASAKIAAMTPATQPAMRRTPPGGPPVAVGIAEPDQPLPWWRRLALRLRRTFGF